MNDLLFIIIICCTHSIYAFIVIIKYIYTLVFFCDRLTRLTVNFSNAFNQTTLSICHTQFILKNRQLRNIAHIYV